VNIAQAISGTLAELGIAHTLDEDPPSLESAPEDQRIAVHAVIRLDDSPVRISHETVLWNEHEADELVIVTDADGFRHEWSVEDKATTEAMLRGVHTYFSANSQT
jgi:carbamate kinase